MDKEILKIINESLEDCFFGISKIETEEANNCFIYNVDNYIEIELSKDLFSISLTLDAPDYNPEMYFDRKIGNDDIDEIKYLRHQQEDILAISQYLYIALNVKPCVETVFQGICPYPDCIISFEKIEFSKKNLKFFLDQIVKGLNFVFVGEGDLCKGLDRYALFKSGANNFSFEADFFNDINDFVLKLTAQTDLNDISDFCEKVFRLIHDFSFYGKQSARALNDMSEEFIRDILLLPVRHVYPSTGGEVFNYDGKSDFKIINPDNKYEYIIGELKWWRGILSFKDVYHQATKKHVTGQEKQIYILVLSRNLDCESVKESIRNYLSSIDTFDMSGWSEDIVPEGSGEIFIKSSVGVRNKRIPLIIGIVDLYFAKQ